MIYRLWTLIRKELQSLLREPQTRAILILPVVLQVVLFPFAATLEVTNATIAIYNEDNGSHSVELTQRFARAKAFSHVLLLKSPQPWSWLRAKRILDPFVGQEITTRRQPIRPQGGRDQRHPWRRHRDRPVR